MDKYLENEKKNKKIKRNRNNENKVEEIYRRFVNEQISKRVPLDKILCLWEDYKKNLN